MPQDPSGDGNILYGDGVYGDGPYGLAVAPPNFEYQAVPRLIGGTKQDEGLAGDTELAPQPSSW